MPHPRFFQELPIKWKLTSIILLVATVVSFALIILFGVYDEQTDLRNKRAKTRMIAEIIGENSIPALLFRDRADALDLLRSLDAEPTIRLAYLLMPDGGVLAEYVRRGETLAIPVTSEPYDSDYFEDDNYYLVHRIVKDGEIVGTLSITSDLQDLEERKRDRLLLGGITAFVFFVLSLWLALRMQRIFTEPITDLTTTMKAIVEQKDYSARAEKRSRDEFGVLMDGFNQMVAEIELRDAQLSAQVGILERTNRELDQFVYVASHDLKAPLRAVDNLSKMISIAVKDLLPVEKQEYLELMHRRVRRMEKLLDDLLIYSRVGRIQATMERVDTGDLLRDIVDLVNPPDAFQIIIPDDNPVIETAKIPLEQVLRNLIGNAIKHHHRKNGTVEVKVRNLGRYLEFSVCDDGPGIPAEYHGRIFQMFQTLKPRDEVEGSGMGLALVKKIIEDQGGEIWLHSVVDTGSCFTFTWPKHPKE